MVEVGVGDGVNVGRGIEHRAKGVKVMEDRMAIIDGEADHTNCFLARLNIALAMDNVVREQFGEGVAFVAATASAWARKRDAVEQRQARQVMRLPF